MLDKTSFCRISLIAATAALAIALPATADDLDVFNASLNSQSKPNLLFILDYSGSMLEDVTNQAITDTTIPSKLTILQDAVSKLLEANKGKINAGIGSVYRTYPSGVKWPISDLEADANTIDPAIPVGTKSVADVISSQLYADGAWDTTATVNALSEGAAYFRGDPVLHNDKDVMDPYHHEPAVWDIAAEAYSGGYHYAAIPFSYTPQNAYDFDAENPDTALWGCTNYVGGDQECEGRTIVGECSFHAGELVTYGPQPASEGSPAKPGGSYMTQDRYWCQYEHQFTGKWTTPNYVSPISQECQANFMVLISDGQPTRLNDRETLRTVLSNAGVPSGDPSKCEDLSQTIFAGSDTAVTEGNCGPEILDYLATTDINPGIENSNVKTYTIGYSLDGAGKEYLKLLAEKGQGAFYEASKPEEVTAALNSVIESITAGSQNFSELSIDVNSSTFSHDNRTYFSLFSPSKRSSWEGNLKGFFLDETGLIDINGLPATIDAGDGIKFADTSQSFWSSTADANDVITGGASESITELAPAPNARNMFTYLGSDVNLAFSNEAILESSNTAITDALMGSPGAALREEALNWIANAPMGDPLHTKPVVVNYVDGVTGAESKVIYIMTNQGFLHAFDATYPIVPNETSPVLGSGGEELFAFMPKELLSNLPEIYSPTEGADHVYGLDGTITRWHDDTDRNGKVNGTETVQLVFGMRRGGGNYYSIDVTNPRSPKFKWQINKDKPGFERLAQTWSRASLVSVNYGGTVDSKVKKRVVMFGGGYDAQLVDEKVLPTEASGNAVFMVDTDGDLVWSIDETDHQDMDYSIPSDLTIIDTDRDGMVDRAYFGDLGGQAWRVDFDNVATNADTTVTKFADLKKNATDHQPVFYAPSVSKNRERGMQYYAVSFGTGDRTQPMLETTQNAFFMLKDIDHQSGSPVLSTATIQASALPCTAAAPCGIYDATANEIASLDPNTADAAKASLKAAKGWRVNLQPGEKALSKVVTFEGKFMATTFEPDIAVDQHGVPEACSFSMIGRLHVMDVADARSIELQSDGTEKKHALGTGRSPIPLQGTTIPSSPVMVFPADSTKVQIVVDKEAVVAVNKKITTVYWHAK